MFNLESSISDWRQQMLAAGIKSPVPLDELESHLREEFERQIKSDLDEPAAFAIAVQHIGQPLVIENEFKKIARPIWDWPRRLKAMLFGPSAPAIPSPESFAPGTRRVLQIASDESRHLNHTFVGTEHLLLGLFKSPPDIFLRVMRRLGIEENAVRAEIVKIVTIGPVQVNQAELPFTPRARQALQLAVSEARAFQQPAAGSEHIFLGLLVEGSGVAALALKNLGVQVEQTRSEILRELQAG
jgi:hypothetical protein